MTQASYAARMAANKRNEGELSPGTFKFITAIEFLSSYAKIMDMKWRNKTDTNLGK